MNNTWSQWDLQETRRLLTVKQTAAYVALNNLYLAVERGDVKLSITVSNQLRVLASEAYNKFDPMLDYWLAEFIKLPGWNNF